MADNAQGVRRIQRGGEHRQKRVAVVGYEDRGIAKPLSVVGEEPAGVEKRAHRRSHCDLIPAVRVGWGERDHAHRHGLEP